MKIDKTVEGGFCFILQGVEIHSNYFLSNQGLFVPNFLKALVFTYYVNLENKFGRFLNVLISTPDIPSRSHIL